MLSLWRYEETCALRNDSTSTEMRVVIFVSRMILTLTFLLSLRYSCCYALAHALAGVFLFVRSLSLFLCVYVGRSLCLPFLRVRQLILGGFLGLLTLYYKHTDTRNHNAHTHTQNNDTKTYTHATLRCMSISKT